jgi:hypothetical protein
MVGFGGGGGGEAEEEREGKEERVVAVEVRRSERRVKLGLGFREGRCGGVGGGVFVKEEAIEQSSEILLHYASRRERELGGANQCGVYLRLDNLVKYCQQGLILIFITSTHLQVLPPS